MLRHVLAASTPALWWKRGCTSSSPTAKSERCGGTTWRVCSCLLDKPVPDPGLEQSASFRLRLLSLHRMRDYCRLQQEVAPGWVKGVNFFQGTGPEPHRSSWHGIAWDSQWQAHLERWGDPRGGDGPRDAKDLRLRKCIQRFPVGGWPRTHACTPVREGVSCKCPLSPESVMPRPNSASQVRPFLPLISSESGEGGWGDEERVGEGRDVMWMKLGILTWLDLFLVNIFIYLFCLHWVLVAVRGLSLVAASGGYSLLRCSGFSL